MQERKRKIVFLASPAQIERVPRLLRHLASPVRTKPLRRVQDQYLDTRTRLLMRAGVVCRLRRAGKRATLTLDSLTPSGEPLADREDLTENLPDGDWTWPGPLPGGDIRTRLLPLSRRLDVQCLFTLNREFRVYDVWTRDGAHLEVTAGRLRVTGSTLGGESHRVEVAPRAEPSEAFERFASDLRRGLKLKAARESDVEYGLRESGQSAPVLSKTPALRLRPQESVRRAAVLALKKYFRQLRWHEPGTRLGLNPECLHDMRVSVRRVRAILRLFRAALPPGTTAKLAAELKWLGQSLGAVRDLDVHLQECSTMRRRLSEAERYAADRCRSDMIRRRKRAYESLRRDLGSPRFKALVAVCRELIRRLRRPAAIGSRMIAREGAAWLAPELRRILKAGRAIVPDTPDEELHRLRVRCKRLRYACETLSGLYGKPAAKMAKRLAALQDVLGAYHDAVAAQALIARAIADATAAAPDADVAYTFGLCAAGWRAEQNIRRAAFPKAWKAFDRKKAHRAFLKAVTRSFFHGINGTQKM